MPEGGEKLTRPRSAPSSSPCEPQVGASSLVYGCAALLAALDDARGGLGARGGAPTYAYFGAQLTATQLLFAKLALDALACPAARGAPGGVDLAAHAGGAGAGYAYLRWLQGRPLLSREWT